MSEKTSFQALFALVKNQPVFADGLQHLKKGREIRIIIDGTKECALFYSNGSPQLEERSAEKPDIEFQLHTEAIRRISASNPATMAEFGILVIKQILAQTIQIRVCTGLISIVQGGYLKIITAAGPEFLGFLAKHGLSNIGKIQGLIKSLKK